MQKKQFKDILTIFFIFVAKKFSKFIYICLPKKTKSEYFDEDEINQN